MAIPTVSKYCFGCKSVKPVSDFCRNGSKADRLAVRCKECTPKMKGRVLACLHCGTPFYVPRSRLATARCCSYKCLAAWAAETSRITKQCVVCGETFKVIPHRKETARFCSRRCRTKDQWGKGSVTCECVACGKAVRRSPSQVVKGGIVACSRQCAGAARRRSMKPPASNVRGWMARRGMVTACTRCGYNAHRKILVVHHRDRNPSNNVLANLEVLCPNCHALEHFGEGGAEE